MSRIPLHTPLGTTPLADSYLTFPPVYAVALDGVRWAHGADAIETRDGVTVAIMEEVEELLAGVFADPPVPHFAHVLTAYYALKLGRPAGFARLRTLFADTRRVPHARRNAGRLIGELCLGVPPPAAPPDWDDLRRALARLRREGEHRRPQLAVEPSLNRAAFERHLADRLTRLSDAALRHWLTHGGPPADDGTKAAKEIDALPARVAAAVADARRRPRLAGAAFLVPALDAALTLPPRRRTADAVPQGGYADVTNRGAPDRLLPSQLALDPDEFVRRFAENELLFFRREEPHTPRPADRIVVLDQGVRTWGGVRLALAAAAAVLLGKGPKQTGRPRLCPTSAGRSLDPSTLTPSDLADRLEASDLSADPAAALAAALDDGADGPRDVVLLTHPRAVRVPGVIAAANRRTPADRLFALAVDAAGRAELLEWTAAGPVPVRAFKLDLAAAEAAGEEPPPAAKPAAGDWSGDREPIGFPFRPGLVSEPAVTGFGFDGDGLLIVGRDGVPQWLPSDGGSPEVLPRGVYKGAVIRDVHAVVGVRGGIVLCGSVTSPTSGRPATAMVHYDFAGHRVRVHELGHVFTTGTALHYAADLHCVYLVQRGRLEGYSNEAAVDLDTGEFRSAAQPEPVDTRAWAAFNRNPATHPIELPFQFRSMAVGTVPAGPFLKLDGNAVRVAHADPPWQAFEPTRDGKPLLAGADVRRAMLAGDVLALHAVRGKESVIQLYRGPDGRAVRDIPAGPGGRTFALSPDGGRLAVVSGRTGVAVHRVAEGGGTDARCSWAGLHNSVSVDFRDRPFRLVVGVGGVSHVFDLDDGRLRHTLGRFVTTTIPKQRAPHPSDPVRFKWGVPSGGPLVAVSDALGQVAILHRDGGPVASFLVRRDKAAAWAAGGHFYGDAQLLGRPATPNAAAAIGKVLLDAGGGAA